MGVTQARTRLLGILHWISFAIGVLSFLMVFVMLELELVTPDVSQEGAGIAFAFGLVFIIAFQLIAVAISFSYTVIAASACFIAARSGTPVSIISFVLGIIFKLALAAIFLVLAYTVFQWIGSGAVGLLVAVPYALTAILYLVMLYLAIKARR